MYKLPPGYPEEVNLIFLRNTRKTPTRVILLYFFSIFRVFRRLYCQNTPALPTKENSRKP